MKNEGFSLILEQGRWRVEPVIHGYWRPRKRESVTSIATVPLFNRRVFHYAQPFDYSGIEWGWIHVGFSLKEYDQSVVSVYRKTVIVALMCAVLSLLVSLIYVGKIVQPILRLRRLVQQIAEGDLSVRADVTRKDELGSLAESVNAMTEALLRRDRILESIRFAAQEFMQTSHWEDSIGPVLNKIGQAAGVDRAYIFENHLNDKGHLCTSQRYEWTQKGVCSQMSNPDLQNLSYVEVGLENWISVLGSNEIISGPVSKRSPAEWAIIEPQGIRSLIVIPVFVEGVWWGFMGLDDCVQEREWTDPEKDSLRAGADMLGATIVRQRIQEALMEAKATLEVRVQERTRELEKQVSAKEKALTELATVQSSLLEMSRAAGMAEVATGVLHNVGNVLNSVNVSCTLIIDQLRESRVGNVAKLAALMVESGDDLGRFLTGDPRGRQIPVYLSSLAVVLQEEHQRLFKESEALHGWVEHIKEIVTMQQTYGRVSGVLETMAPEKLLEDALKLNAGELSRYGITVRRSFQPVPPITVDKHKVLQILLNLINNAKHACTDGGGSQKIITLGIFSSGNGRLTIQVSDNGIGIARENLVRIFHHGFTTRRSGHGFGLHSGALAAKEIGGSLTALSDGPGLGTTFTLELPLHPGDRI
jgi:signal transduction histidine kinase